MQPLKASITASHHELAYIYIDVVDEDGNLCGDVSFEEAEKDAAAITPVPGGVGSVTTAVLMKHVIRAAQRSMQE